MADTQMFLSVSASIAREMSRTQMWQYPGVLCNTPGEFEFSFPPTTISAALGPFSQLRPFHLAILPLHYTNTKLSQLVYIVLNWKRLCFLFSGSNPWMNSGEDESQHVIINEVPCLRERTDQVLWWVSEPLRQSLKSATCFQATLLNSVLCGLVCLCPPLNHLNCPVSPSV